MGDARSGLAAVVADAGPLPPADEAEELDLFGDNPAAGSPIEGSALQLGMHGEAAVRPVRRGRPPGARNLTTEATKRFLLARYRHPLLGLFDVASTSPAELAKLLAPQGSTVTREDLQMAWRLWLDCCKEAAEYVTPKEPRALTITPGSAPLMSMNLAVDQLTLQGITANQALQLGIPESAIKSALSDPIGGEVLEAQVLEAGKTAGNSNV
jgi:hypothetical protein